VAMLREGKCKTTLLQYVQLPIGNHIQLSESPDVQIDKNLAEINIHFNVRLVL